jgi:GTP pyrophosphokinase
VAKLLLEINLDAPTIIAGILHDLPEDTNIGISQIQRQFGRRIAHLVNGVTKLSSVRLKKKWFGLRGSQLEKIPAFERQVNTLRKMFLATSKDIRVVIIKLADRLHNMKTLEHISPDKQLRIARETLEIYAPLADRLGIGKWKTELENLAFNYVYPQEAKSIEKRVIINYKRRSQYLEKIKNNIYKILVKENIKPREIQSRVKQGYSLWKKLERYDGDISKVYDLLGLRIILDNEHDCYKAMSIIHNHFKPLPHRIKDYIASPKPNGYRTLHTTIIGPNKQNVEVQIRDKDMHQEAEQGITAHWYYKENENRKKTRLNLPSRHRLPVPKEQLAWIEELRRWQATITDPNEFKQGLEFDFFKDRIFVFTPQGDVQELPQDATPIDFAFTIHSQVGNNCVGAKVNGKIVPLTHHLRNGDVVEILINKKSTGPKRDWLLLAKSRLAKNRIRKSIREKR